MSFAVNVLCQICGKSFVFDVKTYAALGLRAMPKSCPTCLDEKQGRPNTAKVLERIALAEFSAVANHLPADIFQPFQSHNRDKAILRATLKGSGMGHSWCGKSWTGRLDIYCLADSVPEVVRVRIMEVNHESGQTRRQKFGNMTSGVHYDDVTYSGRYRYMVIEPTDAEPTAALVAASVNHKVTLKGFGLQWGCTLDTSKALWSCQMSNSARSGRFGNQGCIAIVDDDHPVIGHITGKYPASWIFSQSHPLGLQQDLSQDQS